MEGGGVEKPPHINIPNLIISKTSYWCITNSDHASWLWGLKILVTLIEQYHVYAVMLQQLTKQKGIQTMKSGETIDER